MDLQKPSWVEYFTYLALGASMRSKDPKTQVGCVIVDSETLKILSIGYNGFPPGTSNSDKNWTPEQKKDLVVHAEANAVLLKGGANLEDSIAFVTLFPCADCAKMLIQAGVRKIYYLSFRDKYGESEEIFKAALVEFVPIKRGDDGQLKTFQDELITLLQAARQNVTAKENDNPNKELYEWLKMEKKDFREKDIESRWARVQQAEQRSDEVLLKKWTDFFLFLALVASTRSKGTDMEGAVMINSKTFKMCSLSYKGYPRQVEGTPGDAMMVSAIMNVLALRFCEGNNFYAFCTNFPEEEEVKNLAQADVERLYFLAPTNLTAKALSTLKAAEVEVVPMDSLNEGDIEAAIGNTIKGLADKEGENKISFKAWPRREWTPYELEPKRRNPGLEGVTT